MTASPAAAVSNSRSSRAVTSAGVSADPGSLSLVVICGVESTVRLVRTGPVIGLER